MDFFLPKPQRLIGLFSLEKYPGPGTASFFPTCQVMHPFWSLFLDVPPCLMHADRLRRLPARGRQEFFVAMMMGRNDWWLLATTWWLERRKEARQAREGEKEGLRVVFVFFVCSIKPSLQVWSGILRFWSGVGFYPSHWIQPIIKLSRLSSSAKNFCEQDKSWRDCRFLVSRSSLSKISVSICFI